MTVNLKCLVCGKIPTGHTFDDMKSCLDKIDETRFALRKHALERGWTDLLD